MLQEIIYSHCLRSSLRWVAVSLGATCVVRRTFWGTKGHSREWCPSGFLAYAFGITCLTLLWSIALRSFGIAWALYSCIISYLFKKKIEFSSSVLCLNKYWLSVLCLGQNNFMKSQPFTVLTKIRWISFLKAALLSALSASLSRSFPHQILPSRALPTAWQSPRAWRPLCCSPSLSPPCLQTQSKTESPEEPVQSCHRHLYSHHQNQLKKRKVRSQGCKAIVLGNLRTSSRHLMMMA